MQNILENEFKKKIQLIGFIIENIIFFIFLLNKHSRIFVPFRRGGDGSPYAPATLESSE